MKFHVSRLSDLLTYLERIEEVVEAPGDDDVVVQSDHERHHGRRNAQTAQPRVDDVPGAQRSLTQLLTQSQFK